MVLKLYFVLGIIFLLAGSALTIFDTYLYFHLIDLQEQHSDAPANPGSSRPYPEYDLSFFLILTIITFVIGTALVTFEKIRKTQMN